MKNLFCQYKNKKFINNRKEMILMKQNQNNINTGDYYLGIDVGTNSVGWAVTDTNYNILKFRGNSMWGVRLFEEANDASDRRSARTARRRLARRKQRLALLELLFSEEIAKTDKNFFVRMKESFLMSEDKSTNEKFLLFNDKFYTDKDYLRDYPTVFHLRRELVHSKEPHDARLVFLALHHIIKNRGNFLLAMSSDVDIKPLSECIDEFNLYLADSFDQSIVFEDKNEYAKVLESTDLTLTQKKKSLRKIMGVQPECETGYYDPYVLSDMLCGASVKLADLFCDESLKNSSVKSFSFKNDFDAAYDELCSALDDRVELILAAKPVYDASKLSQILNGNKYISDAKVKQYEKNHDDLKKLKEFVKKYYPQKYKNIFVYSKEDGSKDKLLDNYVAYSGKNLRSGDHRCNQEKFCAFLKSQLPDMKNYDEYKDMYAEFEAKTFLPRLIGSDNGVIPCQLHLKELKEILKNASAYLDFLNLKDADGLTVAEKIESIFNFKIPYYVGPLNNKEPNAWVVRTNEKIYPWNFEKVVDTRQSAENFIIKLVGKCTYTGEEVLPKDSLIYSEFMLRNEINMLRVNGKEIPRDVMDSIYNDLFAESNKKVTKKAIKNYLLCNGYIEETDEISGIDDTVKSKLKSYHDFKALLSKGLTPTDAEAIIKRILVFGDDKKLLKEWIHENYSFLNKADTDYICRLKYKDWGRFSEKFLTETYHEDKSGNVFCIMDILRRQNVNIMMLMTDEYQFAKEAEAIRNENMGSITGFDQKINDMYLSPAVKRSVKQTLKIVDEIVDIQKCAPKKIFIEVARGTVENMKGKRTVSRKDKLIDLYKACGEESNQLFEKLNNEDENALRRDKLYLYYAQFGKCMYSGETIDFEYVQSSANTKYDIDHIFPQSRVKDDSIDNRVLIKSELNREKTNTYPIGATTRGKMYPFWKLLKDRGFISDKKFNRLVRSTPLTDKELSEFVARQVVETQQSTKAIANLMKEYYPNTRPVYSKAKNVSDFRDKFEFVKFRELNNLHHAKDAYLNIVVGNVYSTKFTDAFFKNISAENYSLNRVFDYDTPGAWKADGSTISTVKKYMRKNNILVTRKPKEGKGQLFDLTLMPAGKGQLPLKSGMDITKYGGYNKVSGAHFIVVEHTKGKKRIRTLETVLICDKPLYESDPLKYCIENLGLENPKIIVPVVRFDTQLEFDGSKVCITGRTGDRFVCKHTYEFAADEKHEKYLKLVDKYVNRCAKAGKELAITEHDGISDESNLEMYNWFIQRFNSTVYKKLFKNIISDLEGHIDVFEKMSILGQCKILMEILKAFKCDRQVSDFSELCKKKSAGIIAYGKNISNLNSAYLINQSPTGLYEYKIDLLK